MRAALAVPDVQAAPQGLWFQGHRLPPPLGPTPDLACPKAHDRRHGVASGPDSGGVAPVAALRLAEYQSPASSSASPAIAFSIVWANVRESPSEGGKIGAPKLTVT